MAKITEVCPFCSKCFQRLRRHLMQNMDCNVKWLNQEPPFESHGAGYSQCNVVPNPLYTTVGASLPIPFSLIINRVSRNDDNIACHDATKYNLESFSNSFSGQQGNPNVSNLKTMGLFNSGVLNGKRKTRSNVSLVAIQSTELDTYPDFPDEELLGNNDIHAFVDNVTA